MTVQSTYSPSGCNALDLIRHWPCLLKQASNVLGICVNLIYVLLTRHQFPPLSRGAKPVVEKSGTPGIVEYGSYVRVQGAPNPPRARRSCGGGGVLSARPDDFDGGCQSRNRIRSLPETLIRRA